MLLSYNFCICCNRGVIPVKLLRQTWEKNSHTTWEGTTNSAGCYFCTHRRRKRAGRRLWVPRGAAWLRSLVCKSGGCLAESWSRTELTGPESQAGSARRTPQRAARRPRGRKRAHAADGDEIAPLNPSLHSPAHTQHQQNAGFLRIPHWHKCDQLRTMRRRWLLLCFATRPKSLVSTFRTHCRKKFYTANKLISCWAILRFQWSCRIELWKKI